jgi:rfaE bifunctional protein nucleotidyltransferase chain/domain
MQNKKMPDQPHFNAKIYREESFPMKTLEAWKTSGLSLVFTNGCFDLLHRGHIHYLYEASQLGDKLIIGLNSDESVRRIKGLGRPVKNERNRSEILAALSFVDMVILFNGETPLSLIQSITPGVLVKGGDWPLDKIVGADWVLQHGGKVKGLSFIEGESSSAIIDRIQKMGK